MFRDSQRPNHHGAGTTHGEISMRDHCAWQRPTQGMWRFNRDREMLCSLTQVLVVL